MIINLINPPKEHLLAIAMQFDARQMGAKSEKPRPRTRVTSAEIIEAVRDGRDTCVKLMAYFGGTERGINRALIRAYGLGQLQRNRKTTRSEFFYWVPKATEGAPKKPVTLRQQITAIITDDWQSTREIADQIGQPRFNVGNALAKMARAGLLDRKTVTTDRRRCFYRRAAQ